MGDGLAVDTIGLRNAATSSEDAARTLDVRTYSPTCSQPSGAGVAAVNVVLSAVRQRQADRLTRQSATLRTGSTLYDTTDGDGADAISTVRM